MDDLILILTWVVWMPWSSPENLAAVVGCSHDTIRRRLTKLEAEGLVVSRVAGRLKNRTQRFVATSKGLHLIYPLHHSHRGEGAHEHIIFGLETHDPLSHSHPNFFNSKRGCEILYQRLEVVEILYTIAPELFSGHGAAWSPEGRPLKLTSWRWIQNSPLIEAVAEYEGGIRIFCVWVGPEISRRQFRERWRRQFLSRDKNAELYLESIEEGSNPFPSGYLIVSIDEWSPTMAEAVIQSYNSGRKPACCYAVGTAKESLAYTGLVTPASGNVAERLYDKDINRDLNKRGRRVEGPEDLGAGMEGRGRKVPDSLELADRLNGVTKSRAARALLQWPGPTEAMMGDLLNNFRGRTADILSEIRNDGLVTTVPARERRKGQKASSETVEMHYASKELVGLAICRDRLIGRAAKAAYDRAGEDIRSDHNAGAPQFQHRLNLTRCMISLTRRGYHPVPGHRDRVSLPDNIQVVPDGKMRVTADFGRCFVARFDEEVTGLEGPEAEKVIEKTRKVLRVYEAMAKDFPGKPLICVCKSYHVMALVQGETRQSDFQVWAVLPEEAEIGLRGTGGRYTGRTVSIDLDLFIEYERSATTERRAADKLMTYVNAVIQGRPLSVLFICETDKAAEIFRRQHKVLQEVHHVWFPLVTATLKEVTGGKKSGDPWKLNRLSVPLRHSGPGRQLSAI